MSDDVRALVEEAIAAGRLTRVEVGARSRPVRKLEEKPVRFAPELCGKGDKVSRLPRLDELDGDWCG
jgi:hypothetical protein